MLNTEELMEEAISLPVELRARLVEKLHIGRTEWYSEWRNRLCLKSLSSAGLSELVEGNANSFFPGSKTAKRAMEKGLAKPDGVFRNSSIVSERFAQNMVRLGVR